MNTNQPFDRPSSKDLAEDSSESLPKELGDFVSELQLLSPAADRLDRDQIVFLAGQASVGQGSGPQLRVQKSKVWPVAFSAMTTVAAVLLFLLLRQPPLEVSPLNILAETKIEKPLLQLQRTRSGFNVERRFLLSAAPNQQQYLETRLAASGYASKASDSTPFSIPKEFFQDKKTLTPVSIHLLINESS